MGKLCDRNYDGNNMLSVKMEEGVALCPSCNQPASCHGKTIEQRALFWALAMNTGMSSESIAKHMTGYTEGRIAPPSDSSDRARCIRLLEIVPEWIGRLNELLKYDQPKADTGILINSSGISTYDNSWAKQIPLIVQEGKF